MLNKILISVFGLLLGAGLLVASGPGASQVLAQAGEEPWRKEGAQNRTVETAKVPTDCDAGTLNSSNCKIIYYLVTFINILGGLVGITVVGVIVFAGIQYSSARDNPQKVAVARERIVNALIALVAFMVMMGFLQWVIPGGVIR